MSMDEVIMSGEKAAYITMLAQVSSLLTKAAYKMSTTPEMQSIAVEIMEISSVLDGYRKDLENEQYHSGR